MVKMGWFKKIKEKVEGNLAKGSESTPGRVGQAIGRGIAAVSSHIGVQYRRRFSNEDYYVKRRTEDYKNRAEELKYQAKIAKYKREIANKQGTSTFKTAFGVGEKTQQQDYSYLTGGKKKKGDYSFITGK